MKSGVCDIPLTDCHCHVFSSDLVMAPERRYSPDYDATPQDLKSLLTAHGFGRALLIQPSFLATDNSFLLAAISVYEPFFRGVAVVDPSIPLSGLEKLHSGGIRGIRFNTEGRALPNVQDPAWKRLWPWLREHGWHVDVHVRAEQAFPLVDPLVRAGLSVTLDHFGRPGTSSPLDRPWRGPLRSVLALGCSGQVWLKLSGAYRCAPPDRRREFPHHTLPLLLKAFGPSRLIWGSDWPHTTFEETENFASQWETVQDLLDDTDLRTAVLQKNPAALLGRVW